MASRWQLTDLAVPLSPGGTCKKIIDESSFWVGWSHSALWGFLTQTPPNFQIFRIYSGARGLSLKNFEAAQLSRSGSETNPNRVASLSFFEATCSDPRAFLQLPRPLAVASPTPLGDIYPAFWAFCPLRSFPRAFQNRPRESIPLESRDLSHIRSVSLKLQSTPLHIPNQSKNPVDKSAFWVGSLPPSLRLPTQTSGFPRFFLDGLPSSYLGAALERVFSSGPTLLWLSGGRLGSKAKWLNKQIRKILYSIISKTKMYKYNLRHFHLVLVVLQIVLVISCVMLLVKESLGCASVKVC